MHRPRSSSARPARRASVWLLAALAVVFATHAAPADEVGDIFGGFGTATTVADDEVVKAGQGEGTVIGRVVDSETWATLVGATVILGWPAPADGTAAKQEVRRSDASGGFEFASVPPGRYSLGFVKAGYRSGSIADFEVQAGQLNRADFPLPPLAVQESGEVLQLDAFVVDMASVGELMSSLELRMDSDLQLNVLSAEDLSKFAATDVADAIKRVAGVNVIEGQFAIIRGLEDRYSSTLYNAGPIPSPDPSRQSVQLDLFPSEIVSNLVVSKTFGGALPGNSAGGAIDIVTHSYPETLTFKLKGAAGFNTNALDRFLSLVPDSPTGIEGGGGSVVNREVGGMVGGRTRWKGREIRATAVANWQRDFDTQEGTQEVLEPRRPSILREGRFNEVVIESGSLPFGELGLTGGRFDQIVSEDSGQLAAYGALGFDIDEAGDHTVDASTFYTKKDNDRVELKEDGYLPGYNYDRLADRWEDGERSSSQTLLRQQIGGRDQCGDVCATQGTWIAELREDGNQEFSRGPVFFDSFIESRSFETERELLIAQINGSHHFEIASDGFFSGPLNVSWAASHARTQQEETVTGARVFYEPDGATQANYVPPREYPVRVADLGPGSYVINQSGIVSSSNDVDEKQWFGRFDGDYEIELREALPLKLSTGAWFEFANRDVDATFLENPTIGGQTQIAITGDSLLEVGQAMLPSLDAPPGGPPGFTREASNESKREIMAWYFDTKTTFFDQVDVLAGFRLESIDIETSNDAFEPGDLFGAPKTFPPIYLCCDRLDNPARSEVLRVPGAGTVFNDQILGIDVPVDPLTGLVDLVTRDDINDFLSGQINELKVLPAIGLAYRPLDDLAIRLGFSQTVARPSLRELGWYVTVEPGNNNLEVGNPQLELSEVLSVDGRADYSWGWGSGGMGSFSGFYKQIDNAIESLLIRNPIDNTPDALWRTWLNNPNQANLWGIEAELRQSLGFFSVPYLEYVSLGGNFTYINAEVARTEAELSRAEIFFKTAPGDEALFTGLSPTRRLFSQPEWIVNADITFEQPDWGTRLTLAFFGISDLLDAAGAAFTGPDGTLISLTLDRYTDSFNQLDLILTQNWSPEWLRGGELTFGLSAKNLTDSTRRVVYDQEQTTQKYVQRAYKRGRDFKFTLTYSFSAL